MHRPSIHISQEDTGQRQLVVYKQGTMPVVQLPQPTFVKIGDFDFRSAVFMILTTMLHIIDNELLFHFNTLGVRIMPDGSSSRIWWRFDEMYSRTM